jgi:peptidoglycan-associated lipoprotein
MKLNRIHNLFSLALMAMLATTGCKHGLNGPGTVLPGYRPIVSNTPEVPPTIPAQPLPPAVPMAPEPPPIPFQQYPTSTNWDPAFNMNLDRDKLAAYTVHFKFDSTVVQDNERANITSVAQALAANPIAKLLIEGHCDERGTEEYNRSLGERRALALREALAAIGVDPMRIRTVSYGKDQPVDPAHNEKAWAKNRRGQFIWCTPKTPVP